MKPSLARSLISFILLAFLLDSSASQPPIPDSSAKPKSLSINPENQHILSKLQDYPKLESLQIVCVENLQAVPISIGSLSRLKELIMNQGNGCQMNPELPKSMGNLKFLEKLDLFGGQDSRKIGKGPSPYPSIQHQFPSSMSKLQNLKYLDLGRNGIQEVPDFVKDLHNLEYLGFAWNKKVKKLPVFLTQLKHLKTLDLSAGGLTDLPPFFAKLPKGITVLLGNNCAITTSPAKMQSLRSRFPNIKFDFEDEYDCK
jgi:Leucine-rich repeat (LRR) protein